MAHSHRKIHLLVMAALMVAAVLSAIAASVSAQGQGAQPGRGGWQTHEEAYHPSRVIVRFADAVRAQDAEDAVSRLGYSLLRTARFEPSAAFPNGVRFGIVELPKGESVENALGKLGAAPGIMYAEKDFMRYRDQSPVIPNDPRFPEMWGLQNQDLPPELKDPMMSGDPVDDADIDMPEAWARHTNSQEVIVGLIDTGAYIEHPDLAENIWVNDEEFNGTPGVDDDGNGYIDDIHGWDFFNNDNTVWDRDERDQWGYLNDEHGTHTAGTIGAITNNATGVSGINWDIQIIILKFLGPEGGYTSDAILALEYAVDKGAKLTSNSWGGGPFSQALKDAIEASGILFVAAAGNSGVDNDVSPHYPSSYDSPNIIAVGASAQNDQRCYYPGWWSSNWGDTSVDLFAPGGFILSTIPPDPPPAPGEPPEEAYEFFYGTSMATPHVSGVAAGLVSMYPDLPQYPGAPGWVEGSPSIKGIILDTVDVKPAFEGLCVSGGRLNAANAFAMSLPPIVTSANAEPREGEPPLLVTFSASATDVDGEIADYWWDFGDGSPVVHEYNTTHTYEDQGFFDASFHAVDDSGLETTAVITIHVFYPPEIEVNPLSLESSLDWGEMETKTFTIGNTGEGDLHYNIEVALAGMGAPSAAVAWPHMEIAKGEEDPRRGEPQTLSSGGPDLFGYMWFDSDSPTGPPFVWRDISGFGTPVALGDDDEIVVPLPFAFPFYGQTKDQVRIGSNGYLTFGTTGRDWSNDPIPDTAQPNDLLAAFWDDLDPTRGGTIYYAATQDAFIVQYQAVQRLSSGGPYTFQVILSPDGTIMYNYLSMQGDRLDEATIGIENAAGDDGLQVAFNQEYVHNELSVLFVPKWIEVSPTDGTVAPGATETVNVTFRADSLPEADWLADIIVHSDDADEPEVAINTVLHVNAILPPQIVSLIADPWAGTPPLTVRFRASAEDPDGVITNIVWDFGDGSDPVTGTLETTHTYSQEGEYDATLTVTDDEGLSTSRSVHIVAEPLPTVGVSPRSFTATVRAHRTRTETLTISNTGDADLSFTVHAATGPVSEPSHDVGSAVEPWEPASKDDKDPREGRVHPQGMGGPDGFGYIWVDSDQPGGPAFDWVEISGIGTALSLGDDGYVAAALPWEFPFYGETKTAVTISANGYLTFGTSGGEWTNDPIPATDSPNDLLAVWWDDLYPQSGRVFYYYDAARDAFIVEWYQVPRTTNQGAYTFEAILYPDGTIIYQYLNMVFSPATNEAGATIGIENATGTDGLEVLFNATGYIHNGLAIKFCPFEWLSVGTETGTVAPGESVDIGVTFDLTPIGSGALDGMVVVETNDLLTPRVDVPVHVDVLPNRPPVITACGVNPAQGPVETEFQFVAAASDSDGYISDKYWDFGDESERVHEFVALHTFDEEGTYVATFHAIDNDGYETTTQVTVRVQQPPSASWSPTQLFFTVAQGQSASGAFTLSNAGPGPLVFSDEGLESAVGLLERQIAAGEIKDTNAIKSTGVYKERDAVKSSPWLPDAVGDVITSWHSPSPIGLTWGVAVDWNTGNVIISDPEQLKDFVVTPDGQYTGTSWTTPWAGAWPADAAFDGTYVWQVNVGGDNGLYQLDPQTGEVVGSITSVPWTTSQRGVAYNPEDDTFYVGGWNEDVIYHIKGLSWDDPGGLLEKWSMPVGIAGLAYHPNANVLVVTSNAAPDMVYFVDPVSHAAMAEFPHPAGGDYSGAGVEFDADGNLWIASQNDNSMYLVESGLGSIGGWLTWEPASGMVPAGGSIPINVEVDASHLLPGDYTGSVVLFTNDLEYPMIVVPVHSRVAYPPIITEAYAEPTLGEPPLTVTFHAQVQAPETPITSYGWDFGDGAQASELDTTHVYSAEGSYLATFHVTDELGGTATVTIPIEVRLLPAATVEPESLEVSLPSNGVEERTVTIGNVEGHAALEFRVKVRGGLAPAIALPKRQGKVADANARTAEGLYEPLAAEAAERIAANVKPDAVGDVLMSWPLPSEIVVGWGVGFDDEKLWISDPEQRKDFWTTQDGALLGSVNTPWAGAWPADMAYDSNHNLVWQVNVGGDNGLYGLNPETGEVVATLRGTPWTYVSQRGVAYDPNTDTFYIGGWNEDVIYRVKGLDWDAPGQVIEGWTLTGAGISGLAWHPDGILWVSTNSPGDYIYGLDLEALEIVYQFPGPAGGSYLGAGLEINSDGNLWAVTQDNMAWLVSTEMPIARGITVEPSRGTVEPGDSMDLRVTIDAAELGAPGESVANYLEVVTNDPRNQVAFVNVLTHILAGPTISNVTAEPTIGEPPLDVRFNATVTAGAAPITDVWWNFGDGSEPVHQLEVSHTYTEPGTYSASVHALDEYGVEAVQTVEIQVKWLPALEVQPESFDKVILAGTQDQERLTIGNAGNAPMNFWVSLAPSFAGSPEWQRYAAEAHEKGDFANEPRGFAGAGAGGPDAFGYIWMDSTEDNGPVFDWFEINGVGTRVPLEDESGRTVALPFGFPFYGDVKTQVGIASNGYLTFDPSALRGYWTNGPIPDPNDPNDLVAVFWDDLDPGSAGNVYYYYDAANMRFIVEFENVPQWGSSAGNTFQVILKPDGTIVYQYLAMNGNVSSATVGIENASGSVGLQVTYNAPYIQNGLAVAFSPVGSVIAVNPTSGYLLPNEQQEVMVTFGSPEAAPGTYSLYLHVSADDPFRPVIAVPVRIKLDQAPIVELTAPVGGEEWSGEQDITWTAVDADDPAESLVIDLYYTRDGEHWHVIAEDLANTGTYRWNTASVGEGGHTFRIRVVATDPAGAVSEDTSEPFAIANATPVAAFTFAPSPATVQDIVHFTDASTDDGHIVSWLWEFGDGGTSIEQNPAHQYSAKGKYTVRLSVVDDGGLVGRTEQTIDVVNTGPVVKILEPEAGVVWTGTKAIRYEVTDPDDSADKITMRFEYDRVGDDEGFNLIAKDQPNTGEFQWDTSQVKKGGLYKVRVVAVDPDGASGQATSGEFTIVVLFRMVVASPNPVSDRVRFFYDIQSNGTLYVYDIAGRLVHTADLASNVNVYEWDLTSGGRPIANGLYLYLVVTEDGDRSEVGRLVVSR